MGKRTDIHSILILGSGPIIIGQACEFDYSGTQAIQTLKDEGYRTILVNSNPATIMTDHDRADATYIEPLDWRAITKVIEQEKPDALLPTMAGQTALNLALELEEKGILEQYNVELIGVKTVAIQRAEDRDQFRNLMQSIGLECPRSAIAHNMQEAQDALAQLGLPCIIRASFTLGGSGGGIAQTEAEFTEICRNGLELSPMNQILIDESLIGWKEYELEVIRDKKDNAVIVCSIENVDPLGIHTGDSITVAPALTLTDKEYQQMRTSALNILRAVEVETGGANVQFAVNPQTGEQLVIEMNPRVSRSSALASKATGYPIAKIATKLAIGYTLDEVKNDISSEEIPASFEPSLDYIVVKIPRFNFDKFPHANRQLSTQMKAIGEIMALGRTFQEALQKGLMSMECGYTGLDEQNHLFHNVSALKALLQIPTPERLLLIADAFRHEISTEEIFQLTQFDPWFLDQISELVAQEKNIKTQGITSLDKDNLYALKQQGFSDARLAFLLKTTESEIAHLRSHWGIKPVFKRIDSCAGEFESNTAYLYSTYEHECEANPIMRPKVMVVGSGPNRIGQGIEFDYSCVKGIEALKEHKFETIMVNCNPETVSTDYDLTDKLYFEPLTAEYLTNIIECEKPMGVIIQLGGQSSLKVARVFVENGVKLLGTSLEDLEKAENRESFQQLVAQLNLKQPQNAIATNYEQSLKVASQISYPFLIRPSFVLGGQSMRIIRNAKQLNEYFDNVIDQDLLNLDHSPLLLDKFLENAVEIDVDAVSDGTNCFVCGIMEHVEEAGIHSGDSAGSLPPYSLSLALQQEICAQSKSIAQKLNIKGLLNIQFALYQNEIYLLEVNPRASRSLPFIAKATGIPIIKMAIDAMLGETLSLDDEVQKLFWWENQNRPPSNYYAVKEVVFPFGKLGVHNLKLGPEMLSTGEVMGQGKTFAEAYAKAQLAGGNAMAKQNDSCKNQTIILINDDNNPKEEQAQEIDELVQAYQNYAYTVLTLSAHEPVTASAIEALISDVRENKIAYVIDLSEQNNAQYQPLYHAIILYHIAYSTTLRGAQALLASLSEEATRRVTKLQA